MGYFVLLGFRPHCSIISSHEVLMPAVMPTHTAKQNSVSYKLSRYWKKKKIFRVIVFTMNSFFTSAHHCKEQSWFINCFRIVLISCRWSCFKKQGFPFATRKINTFISELQKQSDTAQTLLLFKNHVCGQIDQPPNLSVVACVYTCSSDLLPIF